MQSVFKDSVLLITGGTGSFGNAVLRRFISGDLREIRIFSRDEKKQDDLRRRYGSDRLKFYVGDVRDRDSSTPRRSSRYRPASSTPWRR